MFVVPLMHERDQQYGVKYIEQREIVQAIIYRVFPFFSTGSFSFVSPVEKYFSTGSTNEIS